MRLSEPQIRWFRLRRSGLVQPFGTPEAAARSLAGVQAQILTAAMLALWNRTAAGASTEGEVAARLFQGKKPAAAVGPAPHAAPLRHGRLAPDPRRARPPPDLVGARRRTRPGGPDRRVSRGRAAGRGTAAAAGHAQPQGVARLGHPAARGVAVAVGRGVRGTGAHRRGVPRAVGRRRSALRPPRTLAAADGMATAVAGGGAPGTRPALLPVLWPGNRRRPGLLAGCGHQGRAPMGGGPGRRTDRSRGRDAVRNEGDAGPRGRPADGRGDAAGAGGVAGADAGAVSIRCCSRTGRRIGWCLPTAYDRVWRPAGHIEGVVLEQGGAVATWRYERIGAAQLAVRVFPFRPPLAGTSARRSGGRRRRWRVSSG